MNPDNVNAEALWSLKELHTKLVIQCEKQLLDLIIYMDYVVKYTGFFNYTGSAILISFFSIFTSWASLRRGEFKN